MTKHALGLAASVLALFVWTACVGDDPVVTSQPAGEGAQGQPCFANQTCLTGLVCTSGTCVVVNGADASSGGTSTSSSGGATLSSPQDCGVISGTKTGLACSVGNDDKACGAGTGACCPGVGCQASGAACHSPYNQWLCLSNDQCGGSGRCCMEGSVKASEAPIGCFLKTVEQDNQAACRANTTNCESGEVELCTTGGEIACAVGTCQTVAFPFVGADGVTYVKAIGVCQ